MKYNTRYKPVGWRNESVRHSLAAKGIKTSFSKKGSVWEHPQIKYRMDSGEVYFIKVDQGGYFTKTGPMSLEEAKKEMKYENDRRPNSAIVVDSEGIEIKQKDEDKKSMADKNFKDKELGIVTDEELDYLRDTYGLEPDEILTYEARDAIKEFRESKKSAYKKAYEKAKANGDDRFIFDGHPVLVSYAKYMLEYAEDLRDKKGMSIYKKSMAGKLIELEDTVAINYYDKMFNKLSDEQKRNVNRIIRDKPDEVKKMINEKYKEKNKSKKEPFGYGENEGVIQDENSGTWMSFVGKKYSMALRKLDNDEIERLAGKPGVRKIAVENFLMTVDNNDSAMYAGMNLSQDARSYKWNAATVSAIKEGIRLADKPK